MCPRCLRACGWPAAHRVHGSASGPLLQHGPIGLAQTPVCHTHGASSPYSAKSYRAPGAPAPGHCLTSAPASPLRATLSPRRQPCHVQPTSWCGPLLEPRTSAARILPPTPMGSHAAPELRMSLRVLAPCTASRSAAGSLAAPAELDRGAGPDHLTGPPNCRAAKPPAVRWIPPVGPLYAPQAPGPFLPRVLGPPGRQRRPGRRSSGLHVRSRCHLGHAPNYPCLMEEYVDKRAGPPRN
ncbi:hypothetical protein NDU88_003540 [Pleurodeles waltl]|uniref:Uncharacterized protein n=1 Tax=Pleurodeles waltl TaxID=8319 RepID=A0AAV7M5N9_PLEWA|nr:hypothetical protein NDU88_003540 [Pleurodeles waltl]